MVIKSKSTWVMAATAFLVYSTAIHGDDTTAQKVCVDPATGRLVSPDENPACRDSLRMSQEDEQTQPGVVPLDQSTKALTEETMPQGGTKVDLQGRFQSENASDLGSPTPNNGSRIAIIDPRTGRLATGETAALLRRRADLSPEFHIFQKQLNEMLERSQDVSGLTEQSLQSGAVKVDLQGRFQNPLMATISPRGGVLLHHAAYGDSRDTPLEGPTAGLEHQRGPADAGTPEEGDGS